MIHIKVPATSANMGSGFDSIGVAVKLYNNIWIEEIDKNLPLSIKIKKEQEIEIPTNEENLIYQTIVYFFNEINKPMPQVSIIQEDYVPMVRGLGSSATCIIGGLMAGNALAGYPCNKEELAKMATKLEGHPDNVVPAIYGNMVVGVMEKEDLKFVHIDIDTDLVFATMIPDFPVSTKDARDVLPDTYTREDMIYNSSRTALLVGSMLTKNYANLKVAVGDKIHQPYRKILIPNMEEILDNSIEFGGVASYLSGAGSTLMAIVEKDKSKEFEEKMNDYLRSLPNNWKLLMLQSDTQGAVYIEE